MGENWIQDSQFGKRIGMKMDIHKEQCSVCQKWFKNELGVKIHQGKSVRCKQHLSGLRRFYCKSEVDCTQDTNHSDADDRVSLKTATHKGIGILPNSCHWIQFPCLNIAKPSSK